MHNKLCIKWYVWNCVLMHVHRFIRLMLDSRYPVDKKEHDIMNVKISFCNVMVNNCCICKLKTMFLDKTLLQSWNISSSCNHKISLSNQNKLFPQSSNLLDIMRCSVHNIIHRKFKETFLSPRCTRYLKL